MPESFNVSEDLLTLSRQKSLRITDIQRVCRLLKFCLKSFIWFSLGRKLVIRIHTFFLSQHKLGYKYFQLVFLINFESNFSLFQQNLLSFDNLSHNLLLFFA